MSSIQKRGFPNRAYLTPEQEVSAAKQFGCGRFVYNHLLDFTRTRYFTNKTKTTNGQRSLELTRLKTELPWLQEVNAQSLQQTGRALDTAYANWFDSLTGKRPDKVKPPTHKKKSERQSARFTKGSFTLRDGVLTLSKIGVMRVVWHNKFKAEPSSVVLSKTPSGRYNVSFQVEEPLRVVGSAKNRVSVDLNTKTFNFFDGRGWRNTPLPRPLLSALSRLRSAQKHLSRCKKGSKNREKARLRVARIHQRVADIRKDFLQKLSTQLVCDNQVIFVETLRVKNMVRNRRLARVISDAGFGDFIRMLEYKCKWYGRTLVKIDTFFPSSKTCCVCHQVNSELKLQDRWRCQNCETKHQRDENAVVNIFVEGLRILAEGRSVSACGDAVRLERKPKRVSVKRETSSEIRGNAA
jgi:putative transposase